MRIIDRHGNIKVNVKIKPIVLSKFSFLNIVFIIYLFYIYIICMVLYFVCKNVKAMDILGKMLKIYENNNKNMVGPAKMKRFY